MKTNGTTSLLHNPSAPPPRTATAILATTRTRRRHLHHPLSHTRSPTMFRGMNLVPGHPVNNIDLRGSQTHLVQMPQLAPLVNMVPSVKSNALRVLHASYAGPVGNTYAISSGDRVAEDTIVQVSDLVFTFPSIRTDVSHGFSSLAGMSSRDFTNAEFQGVAYGGNRGVGIQDAGFTLQCAGAATVIYNGTGIVRLGDLLVATFAPPVNPAAGVLTTRHLGNALNKDPDARVMPVLTKISPATISATEFGGDRAMLTRAMVRYHIPDAIAVLSRFFATIAGAWAAPVSPATLQGANNALIQWWHGGAAGAGPAADTGVDIDLPSPNDIMRHVLNTVGGVAAAATNIHAFAVYIDILGAFSRGVLSRHLAGKGLSSAGNGGAVLVSVNSRG